MARAIGSTGQAKVLTKIEFNRALAVINGQQLKYARRNQCILQVSYYLGLRVSEIAALTLGHVISANGELRDCIQLTSSITKGNKHRDVYLSHSVLRAALKRYIVDQFGENPAIQSHGFPLFNSQKGGKFTSKTLGHLIKKLYLDAGIEGATSHSGRRSLITNLAEQGIDIKSIAVIAGHSSISTTAMYIDASPTKLANIMSRLN